MSEEYLGAAAHSARCFLSYRDKYATPGGEMWVTESGDAGAGGHTWASTYAEVIRTLNEIGSFVTITDGVIFHNTLASSDYGWLKHGTFVPRPSYFAVLLWKRLMGNTVYASGEEIRPGCPCGCRRAIKTGYGRSAPGLPPPAGLRRYDDRRLRTRGRSRTPGRKGRRRSDEGDSR